VEFKSTMEEVNTSSAFARSVPMARPNGMVVEVNDVFVPRSQAARGLSTQLCNLTHNPLCTQPFPSLMTRSYRVDLLFVQLILLIVYAHLPLVVCPAKFERLTFNTTPLVRHIRHGVRQPPGSFHAILEYSRKLLKSR
jgi:hypothetical protein